MRGICGLVSLTVKARLPNSVYFKASIAAVASSCEDIATKPNPLDWWVNVSLIMLADATVPCAENNSVNSSCVAEYGSHFSSWVGTRYNA